MSRFHAEVMAELEEIELIEALNKEMDYEQDRARAFEDAVSPESDREAGKGQQGADAMPT